MPDTVHYHSDPHMACVDDHASRAPLDEEGVLDLARRLHLISHEHAELWDVTPDCGCLVRARVMLDAVVVDGRAYFGSLPRGQ